MDKLKKERGRKNGREDKQMDKLKKERGRKNGREDKQMDKLKKERKKEREWKRGQTNGQTKERKRGQTNGRTKKVRTKTNRQTDDRQTALLTNIVLTKVAPQLTKTNGFS
jgi:hypothetical protein